MVTVENKVYNKKHDDAIDNKRKQLTVRRDGPFQKIRLH